MNTILFHQIFTRVWFSTSQKLRVEILRANRVHVLWSQGIAPLYCRTWPPVVLQKKSENRRWSMPNHGCNRVYTMGNKGRHRCIIGRVSTFWLSQGTAHAAATFAAM